ncbi:MAG: DUF1425 domain-containing protein [Alphaproteobacteria bacterium]|nr:DUF1425 domain-containing protein [Alphaproteobacteria bacterium]
MKKFVLCFFSMFLVGCVGTQLEYDHEKMFISPDVELANVQAHSYTRERDGQVFVQVRGLPTDTQSVYYKVEWFDQNEMKLTSTLSNWKKVNLTKNMEFTWKEMSPSKRAVSYRVHIVDKLGKSLID